jgi:hypothetical protein
MICQPLAWSGWHKQRPGIASAYLLFVRRMKQCSKKRGWCSELPDIETTNRLPFSSFRGAASKETEYFVRKEKYFWNVYRFQGDKLLFFLAQIIWEALIRRLSQRTEYSIRRVCVHVVRTAYLYPMLWLNSCFIKTVYFLASTSARAGPFALNSTLSWEENAQHRGWSFWWGHQYRLVLFCYNAVQIMSVMSAERWLFSLQMCTACITPIIRKMHYLYFGCLAGDHDKGWALYICSKCNSGWWPTWRTLSQCICFMPLHVSSNKCSSSGGTACVHTSSGITHSGGWLSDVPIRSFLFTKYKICCNTCTANLRSWLCWKRLWTPTALLLE